MRVFDFDGTIYDGESLFDLYLFSAKYNPKVLRYIAPVLRYAIKYKLGRATFDQMEYGVGKLCHGYLSELAESLEFEELVNIQAESGSAAGGKPTDGALISWIP